MPGRCANIEPGGVQKISKPTAPLFYPKGKRFGEMPHVTITTDGAICYRSKTMTVERAAAFARCLAANAERFTSVEIVLARTKETQYLVQFRPVDPERQGDIYEQQWNVRAERAQQEGAEYIFWRDADKAGVTWCFNPQSGETYEVTPFGCTCPDYHYRCRRPGCTASTSTPWNCSAEPGGARQDGQADGDAGAVPPEDAQKPGAGFLIMNEGGEVTNPPGGTKDARYANLPLVRRAQLPGSALLRGVWS